MDGTDVDSFTSAFGLSRYNDSYFMTMPLNASGVDINSTLNEQAYIPYMSRPETYIVPMVFIIVFIVGLLGNGTLIYIFIRNKSMRSIPNTYIISLSIGDLLVIVGTVPFISTIYTFDSWPYGVFMCKLSEFLRDISSGVTVLTLTLLSVDRYIAIVKPLHKLKGHSGKNLTLLMACCVWVIAVAIAIPGAYFSFLWEVSLNPDHTIYVCYPFPENMIPWYPRTMVLLKFFLLYVIPLSIIAVFYALMARYLLSASNNGIGDNDSHIKKRRDRTKVAKIVLVFVILFAVCFFPSHVFMLWYYFNPNAYENYSDFWHAWKILGYVLTFVNSCLNPIALYFISGVFRFQFQKNLFCCGKKKTAERHYLSTFRTPGSSSNRSIIRTTVISRI